MINGALASGMLAAEGGYQSFTLEGGEMLVLLLSGLSAVVAIVVGLNLMRGVLAADQGTPKMIEIAAGDPGRRRRLPASDSSARSR